MAKDGTLSQPPPTRALIWGRRGSQWAESEQKGAGQETCAQQETRRPELRHFI